MTKFSLSAGSSPQSSYPNASTPYSSTSEELVEVILDFQEDDTVILRSIEPANDTASTSSSLSHSSSFSHTSSHRIRLFSQELKAEAVAKAKQFTQDLKAELKKLPWTSRSGTAVSSTSSIESALAARALRKKRAQLDRTRPGAQKAIRGLRFISRSQTNGLDAWDAVQVKFDELACDGLLSRSDFGQCIGMKDSNEFALEVFDALSRRREMKMEVISMEELYEFWLQITDQSFDSRLQIFFDMY